MNDASTKTYKNADDIAELGLQGCLQKVNISLLNDTDQLNNNNSKGISIDVLPSKNQALCQYCTRINTQVKALLMY